ncbi:proton-dependent oligopeptide transport family protein [Heliocybe sulcata]|uniref:Proton-dependent oligopeptide transport family protein n=1 Tax=Heliocybe sulcata TaxID=5364 RepID=A0A5C3MZS8_9AGAM|nr:proton-dependent oligopeptide transport family protein [Heliocybe sulcata]
MAGLTRDDAVLAGLAEAQKDEVKYEKQNHSLSITTSKDHDHDYEPDGIHDGLEFPTSEECETLRRVSDTVPWSAYMIAFVELAERFSFYGATVVFTNFIQQPLPVGSRTGAGGANGQSGALGRGQQTATGLTTFNQFWCYVIPLFGAYIADTRWGRFKTICISVAIAMVGHILLVMSAIPPVITKPNNALACFVVALVIMGLGTGGFKANISPLVAEQYKRTKLFVRTTKSGERVIVDPVLTTSRIYMYFYLFTNIGALIGQISMAYSEKYVGFWLAYLLPTIVFSLCPIVLALGARRYNTSPPTGSVFAQALRAWRYCLHGRWSWNYMQMCKNMTAADFWETAKPSNVIAKTGSKPGWMTFDDQWVDELRRGFKACGVFVFFPIYWLTYNQLNNNLTSQAATMSTHGVPNDVLSNLDPFALIIFIPIFDQFIYPGMRRIGINPTPLKKITAGFFTGAAGMIWAAVVQHYIYKTSPCGYEAATCADADGNALVSPLNVWIQTGSYVLIAFSEILASITGLEYAFTKAPKNMRSLVMSMFLFMSAIASALGEAFVTLAADPLLVWNYGVFGVIAFIGGCLFWYCFRHLDEQEDELNNLAEGHYHAEKEG